MEKKLIHGPITKSILLFSAPIILGNLLQQLYNVVDTLIVGRFLGADALRLLFYPDGISDLRYPRALHGKRDQLLHTVWRRQYAAPSCMFSSFLHYDRADYYFNQSSCPAPAGSYHDAPAHSCKHTPGNQKLPAGHFIRTFFYFPVQLFLIAASCFGEFPCAASFPCAFRAHEYRA